MSSITIVFSLFKSLLNVFQLRITIYMGFGFGISVALGGPASSTDSSSIFENKMLLPHLSGFLVTVAELRGFSHLTDP